MPHCFHPSRVGWKQSGDWLPLVAVFFPSIHDSRNVLKQVSILERKFTVNATGCFPESFREKSSPAACDASRAGCNSPVTPNRLCGGGPTSGLMACRSGVLLNQPISFLLCASPRCRGESAQPNRKALVPWTRSVSPRATADNENENDDDTDVQMENHVIIFSEFSESSHM